MAESYTPPGMSVSYTVPELSDPADAPQAFREFADSISGVSDQLTVIDVLGNITLEANDEGAMLACDTMGAGDIEITFPDNASVPLPIGFVVAISNLGGSTNVVKLKKGTGVNIQDQGFLQVEDYRTTTAIKVSTDFWLLQAGSATYTPPANQGLEGFGDWATVTATTGSPTKYEYTDGTGTNWTAYEWTGDGTVTTSGGLVDALIVNSGANSYGNAGGNAGKLIAGLQLLDVSNDVFVGTSIDRGVQAGSQLGNITPGPREYFGGTLPIYSAGAGYQGHNSTSAGPGFQSSITGTQKEYSRAYTVPNGADLSAYEFGDGGQLNQTNPGNQTAKQGVVIVRVPSAYAQA